MSSYKILVAGNFNSNSYRLHVLLKGLQELNVPFIQFPLKQFSRGNIKKLRNLDKEVDLIYMPPYTHDQVAFVRKHTTKPLVFDPYVSQYYNQKIESSFIGSFLSPKHIINLFNDKRSFANADLILGTSVSHANKLKKLAKKRTPVAALPVGFADDEFFPQKATQQKQIKIGYTGRLTGRYGIDVILKAAKLLEHNTNVKIELLGSGSDYQALKTLLKKQKHPNIKLTQWHKLGDLNTKINEFTLCLGDFGSSSRTDHVMPEDLYRYAACQKPIISRPSTGTEEVFKHNANIILAEPDAASLAHKIEELLRDETLRKTIAENACKNVTGAYTHRHIAQNFLKIIAEHFPQLNARQ